MRLRAASSRSCGRFVAASTSTLLSLLELTPSNWTKNSVLSRREASCSYPPLAPIIESISSMKMTDGARSLAKVNRAFINFSPSPIHFDVRVDALQLKNVELHSVAIAFASNVFPVPGGPYNKIPLDGDSRPLNMSGLIVGKTTVS